MAVVRARGLTKRYGALVAVDHLDLDIEAGECFGFLGPNGAGKTTTMRMVIGLSPPDDGTLEVFGLDVRTGRRAIKARLGVVPQEDNLTEDLSVRRDLRAYARFYGLVGEEARRRGDELLTFMELAPRADDLVRVLSGGMKRRLVIARGLVNRPEMLVLDEPTTGLDPQARQLVWSKLAELKAQGVTMLLTTHYMEEAEALCDRLVIVDRGRVIAQGRPGDLIATHIGREVLELRVPVAEEARVLAAVAGVARAHERVGERLLLQGDDADALLRRVEDAGVRPEEARLRRATLEDVFLRLAGRQLGEGS